MRVDDNWKKTRILAQDIDQLLGLPVETSEKYLQVLEDLIIHNFLELVLSTDTKDETVFELELPYLGTLIITVKNGKHLSTDFVARPLFNKKLQTAYTAEKSPLVHTCVDLLSKKLVKQFEEGELPNE